MKSTKIAIVIVTVFISIILVGFFNNSGDIYFSISRNMELFGRIYKEISFNYVEEINPEEFLKAAIRGMLSTLDPYTIFIDEDQKDDIELITNGKYGGVGITIGVRGEDVTVVEVLDGYSAQKQGLRIGDILIEAAGKKISPENIDEISSLVKGDAGTTVDLTILRNDKQDTIRFSLIREEVIVKNLAFYGFYPENSNNVYIKLTNFSRSAGEELRNAIKELKQIKPIESIVFDLRGNPGGLLDVAVDISNKFLPKGLLVVTTKGRDEKEEKVYYASQEPLVPDTRLVVLINGSSASASEIVAGAIQDHDRGIILGTHSFGKGLVQTIVPLSYNSSLKITTAKYFTPSGRSIQKINYGDKNKVFSRKDSMKINSYKTDNERIVFSGGGITPDSTVRFEIEGEITKQLLAKGLFFKFADHYYYKNSRLDYKSLKDDSILKAFEDFVAEDNFHFHSEAEKQIEKLISDLENKKSNDKLREELSHVRKQLEELESAELKIYNKEILREIKSELIMRYLGTEAQTKELLNFDTQFQAALNIVSDSELYRKILKKRE
ncbi:MAG: PDZ domain-containing protein [Ignavibacteriaceae bacterium]|nr:PDZ domain-containing protein [Ignavibacteriaceae bacterium]